MHRYILTDSSNLFHRQINSVNKNLGIDNMIGMALHLILSSAKKEYVRWKGTHLVFFLEGRSWRKDFYKDYKANRKATFAAKTEQEQEDHLLMQEAFEDLTTYLNDKTNATVLRNPIAEADDMIQIWIENHPDDEHVLISSDSDFYQLLRYNNVTIYDPIKDITIKRDGIYNDKEKRLSFTIGSNAKIKVGKEDPTFTCEEKWYEYALFLKCIRGDSTDNIFTAYPKARENGTKDKIGIREAYEDKEKQGYSWQNFMLQRWEDHNNIECRVKDKYEFNRKLIDLTEIPDNVKSKGLEIILEQTGRKSIPAIDIGHQFMKFTSKWDLKRISDNASDFMPMLKSKYLQE